MGFPGSSASGLPITSTSPSSTSPATTTWLSGQEPQRIPEPRADGVEDQGADGDPGEERRQDHREDVGRVAGPGRQEPGPRDLVGE